MLVENRDEVHGFFTHAEVHRIGKPPKQRASNVVLNLGELQRPQYRTPQNRIEFDDKLIAEAGPLFLVPSNRIGHVEFRLRTDAEAFCHRFDLCSLCLARRSSRNSSQDLPGRESASFARRSSRTSRCRYGSTATERNRASPRRRAHQNREADSVSSASLSQSLVYRTFLPGGPSAKRPASPVAAATSPGRWWATDRRSCGRRRSWAFP